MPRNGSDIYFIPPGTEGFPDTTIESEKYNNYIHDVETDLNRPRPISAGGTGATSADGALINLSAEKANQSVSNFNTHTWMSGSFNSGTSAIGSPVDGHAFAGIVYKASNGDFAVEARDVTTGFVYTRVQVGGVWSVWGRTDAPLTCADDPPTGFAALDNSLWFESSTGLLYVRYNDGDSSQWCIACPQPDISTYAIKTEVDADLSGKVSKTGDTMSGMLTINGATSSLTLDKITDSARSTIWGSRSGSARWRLDLGNDTTETGSNAGSNFQLWRYDDAGAILPSSALTINRGTGLATIIADPTVALGVATKQYVDTRIAPDVSSYGGMQVNGSFDVSQEKGIAATSATGYICDGWMLTKTLGGAGVVAFSQFPSPGVFPNAMSNQLVGSVSTIQATLGATDVVHVSTRIEGYRTARLGWGGINPQPITVSFWSGHAPAGKYSVSIHNSADNRSYTTSYIQTTANVLQYNTIVIPGEPNGNWNIANGVGLSVIFTMAAGIGALQTSSTEQWLASNAIAATGQVNGLASVANSFKLAQVIILPGLAAPASDRSALIMRPFPQELELCKRYYEKSYNYTTPPGANLGHGSNGILTALSTAMFPVYSVIYTVEKRAAANFTVYAGTGPSGGFSYYDSTIPAWTGTAGGATAGGSATTKVYPIYFALQPGMTMVGFDFTADARL